MATAAVAHEVDEDVLAEATAVLGRQATNPHNGFGIVAVDVENRAAESLRHVGGVVAGPGGIRCGRETNLVVDHDVDGTANGVSTQLSERAIIRAEEVMIGVELCQVECSVGVTRFKTKLVPVEWPPFTWHNSTPIKRAIFSPRHLLS